MSTPENQESWTREPSEVDRTIEDNWLFRLRRERFRSRLSGRAHDYYVMHLADAVHAVALTPEGDLVMVEQFRVGSGRDSLETPGGLLEPGEDPLVAGIRELLEETGYAGGPPTSLGAVWSNPSLLTSRITTIFIPDARLVAAPKPDEGEEVRVVLVEAKDVLKLIRSGKIDHALAVQGLLTWWIGSGP